MKKVSTVATKQSKNCPGKKLTIGLDLGDRWSWYCALDGAGEVLLEQKLGTTPQASGSGPECPPYIGLAERGVEGVRARSFADCVRSG
jgi:hypothetical protein